MFLQIIKRQVIVKMLFLVLPLLLVAPPALAQGRDWEPQKAWVFVVGTLRWKHADMFGSFPQPNRHDAELVKYFRQEGVPSSHIIYLRDQEATASRIQNALQRLLTRAGKDDLLFLYYTGHGYKSVEGETYLASYDAGDEEVPGWAIDSIPVTIERFFKGSRAFLTLDNCYSGALAEAVAQRTRRVSYAVLTSSTSEQSSTGEWTFTEGLIAALRGKAYQDSNDDGQVTLAELAAQVSADMSFAEQQRAVFTMTGGFSPQTVLSRAEQKRDTRVGQRVLVKSEGNWYKGRIIDTNSSSSRLLIDYYGWDDSFNEWVTPKQIRSRRQPASTR